MTDTENATFIEKAAVIVIFGGMAFYMAYKGNDAAMTAFMTTLATYFLSRQGV